MDFIKRNTDKDGRKSSRDRDLEPHPPPEQQSDSNEKGDSKFSARTLLKRSKDKDGRNGSKDRSSEKEPSPEKDGQAADANGKATMTDKVTTFMYALHLERGTPYANRILGSHTSKTPRNGLSRKRATQRGSCRSMPAWALDQTLYPQARHSSTVSRELLSSDGYVQPSSRPVAPLF